MIDDDLIFSLYSNCRPVRGASRSIICDLQLGEYALIPNILFDILNEHKTYTIRELKQKYDDLYNKEIDGYFEFLIERSFGRLLTKSQLKNKMKLDLEWAVPSKINNAILVYDNYSDYDLLDAIIKIEKLGCKVVQLRFYDNYKLNDLKKLLISIENINIQSIEVLIKYNKDYSIPNLEILVREVPRLKSIFLHSSPFNKVIYSTNINNMGNVLFFTNSIQNETHCGLISPDNFRSTLSMFSESVKFNNCLNKKIGISKEGLIKNCPSLKQSYGHIKDDSLEKVIDNQQFKELWYLSKDKVKICQICEFRYICSDCRAYLQNQNDIQSKPLKCGYDPYTGKWSDWTLNDLSNKEIS